MNTPDKADKLEKLADDYVFGKLDAFDSDCTYRDAFKAGYTARAQETGDVQVLLDALNEVINHGHSNLCQSMKPYRPNYICQVEVATQALAQYDLSRKDKA